MKIRMPDGEIRDAEFPQFKTPYNHDTNLESDRTALFCKDPSLTKQEFKEETDINVLLARFKATGAEPPMVLPEHFVNTLDRTTYFDMACASAEASSLFYQLDAELRARYQNNPAYWADAVVEAVTDGNTDALKKLGVTTPQAAQEPIPPGTPATAPAQPPAAPTTGGTPPVTPT